MSKRQPRIVAKAITDHAKTQPCVNCTADDMTIVFAHWNIPGFFGMGMKIHDFVGAFLCRECHAKMDNQARDYITWTRLLIKTWIILWNDGIIGVKDGR